MFALLPLVLVFVFLVLLLDALRLLVVARLLLNGAVPPRLPAAPGV
jgi:hypothetical protein